MHTGQGYGQKEQDSQDCGHFLFSDGSQPDMSLAAMAGLHASIQRIHRCCADQEKNDSRGSRFVSADVKY
jgi:hypothetical protein